MTPPPASAVIRLHLGRAPTLVSVQGDELALSRKDAALLALLAVDGARRKDEVAALLWPDADASRARLSLRQRRFRLARAAGAPVVVGEDLLRLHESVLTALRLDEEGGEPAPETALLEPFFLDGCPDFMRWLQDARPVWRRQISEGLERRADRLEADGRLVEALALARRLADDEPLSDRAHRRLIWLHYLKGDLGRALAEYKAFCDRLADELGELPDDATGELVARIRLGEHHHEAPRQAPPAAPWQPPFVGREAEMVALQRAALERQPVLLEGMPGMGKTRLVGEVLRAQPQWRSLHVPVFPGERHRPYAVLARLLASLWLGPNALQPQGHATLPVWARRELGALLPELYPAEQVELRPLRLQSALECALEQAGPQVVVIDDLQQADQATLELLPTLNRPGLPPWWLVCRTGERPAEIDAWLHASPAPRMITLQPLGLAAVDSLLAHAAQAAPAPPAAGTAAAILQSSGGVTFLVVELVKTLAEGRFAAGDGAPQGAAHFIRLREASLGATARQMARTAAVLRSPLPAAVAAALWESPPAPWHEALLELEALCWVDAQARMHDLVASALYEAMSLAERQALHARVAAWLERSGSPPADVAHHREAAGQAQLAAPLFERAAAEAARACRVAEQARFQCRAAEAWRSAGCDEASFQALRASLDPLTMGQGAEAALPVAQQMLAQARGPLQHVQAHLALADLDNHRGHYQEAEARVARLQPVAQSLQDPDVVLQLGAIRAYALGSLSRVPEALAVLEQVEDLQASASPDIRKYWRESMVAVCWRAGQLGRCAMHTQALLDQLTERSRWSEAVIEASNLAAIQTQLGHFLSADEWLRTSLTWREMLGPLVGHTVAGLDMTRAVVNIGLGHAAEALAAVRHALQLGAGDAVPDRIHARALEALARIHLVLGQSALARAVQAPLAGVHQPVQATRNHLLAAATEAAEGLDPQPALVRAHQLATEAGDAQLLLRVTVERLCCDPVPDLAELEAAEQQARQTEQGALAARVAWHRVGVLLARPDAAAAAALARQLLDDVAWPEDILPCHWQWLGARALHAVGDPQALAWRQRAEAALARTCQGLSDTPHPTLVWPRFVQHLGEWV